MFFMEMNAMKRECPGFLIGVQLRPSAVAFIFCGVAALSVLGLASPLSAAEPVTIEVRAGAHDRRETPVRAILPADLKPGESWRLVRAGDGKEIAVQLLPAAAGEPAAILWILDEPLAAGQSRRYRLEPKAPAAAAAGVACKETAGQHLLFQVRGKDAIRYNSGVIPPPPPVEPLFGRSGYLHPVWSPGGAVVTNDHPLKHKHHHGIWYPWTHTTFEKRKVDFWNTAQKQGTVECVGVDAPFEGPVAGGLRARHRFLDLTAPGGPKEALKETWEVTVYNVGGCHLFDLASVQSCAGSSPLVLEKYTYGGIGVRGSGEWEAKDSVAYLTSEGKTRVNGNAQPARWCRMTGKVGDAARSLVLYCHPANFRAPQHMRLHPSEPFMCFCPAIPEKFEIVPGKPYAARYRFSVHDGEVAVEEVERIWKDYAEPPEACVVK
jgi:hypothetical protein